MRKLLGRNAIGTLASSLETLLLLLGSAAQSLSGPSAQSKMTWRPAALLVEDQASSAMQRAFGTLGHLATLPSSLASEEQDM